MITQKFDYVQYLADAEASKVNPLEQRILEELEKYGIIIRCYALPGLYKEIENNEHGKAFIARTKPLIITRYLFNMKDVAIAADRGEWSIIHFLSSQKTKPIKFEIETGENVYAIPKKWAVNYWRYQERELKNPCANDIVEILLHQAMGYPLPYDFIFNKSLEQTEEEIKEQLKTEKPKKTVGVIYFITDDEFVKVGYSEDPLVRLTQLQIGNPKKLKILLTIKATEDIEQELHKSNKKIKQSGEWYRLEHLEYLKQEVNRLSGTLRGD